MKNIMIFLKKHWFIIVALVITVIGFVMRFICCFWGRPLQLHPDEHATVDWVVEMLKRHSWEAHSYDRPDHFEIKCDAIIFTIFSWMKYHKPAYEAFAKHKMAFYFLARFLTTLFGTALIPLTGLYVNGITGFLKKKYRQITGMLAMTIVSFSTIFVQHSAYATPDIVLAFFVLLFTHLAARYLENGNEKIIYLLSIIIGIGVTIKYPAAILSIPLALIVTYRALVIEKRPYLILGNAILSIAIMFGTIFVMAPNLITDYQSVYENFIDEARPTHLGADGLGFGGNLRFYFDTIKDNLGRISIFPLFLGVTCLIYHRNKRNLSILVGVIFWICISVLSLHWVRWGIPAYPFYVIIMSVGVGVTIQFLVDFTLKQKLIGIIGNSIVVFISAGLVINIILSGLCITKFSWLVDVRCVSSEFCKENGITKKNCIYEGYTPLKPGYSSPCVNAFVLNDDGSVKVKRKYKSKKYFVMSDSFKSRYFAQMERYPKHCAVYNAIESTYKIVYRVSGDGNYWVNSSVSKNILNSIKYLLGRQSMSGSIITIYEL